MIWADKIAHIASLIGEPELLTATPISGELDVPNFVKSDIEKMLLCVSQEMIREYDPQELQAIGSKAISIVTGAASPVTLPLNALDVIGVSIDSAPGIEASVAGYYQHANVDIALVACYAYSEVSGTGKILYTGTNISAIVLIEPPLADFVADLGVLPPASEPEICLRVLIGSEIQEQ